VLLESGGESARCCLYLVVHVNRSILSVLGEKHIISVLAISVDSGNEERANAEYETNHVTAGEKSR
jgi:hypothetical protein